MPREHFAVAVIGGGSAGLAAAVSAARTGARTLLVERYGFLGGMGTASLVFAGEMEQRMIAATGLGPVRMGRVDVLPQHPVEFVTIADELVAQERELTLELHTEVLAVTDVASGWEILLGGRAGVRTIRAASLVDASGDAAVAGLLGEPTSMAAAPQLQRPAYVFGIYRSQPLADGEKLQTAGLLVEGVRSGELPVAALGLAFRASGRAGEIFATLDLTGAETAHEYDPLNARCLTDLEVHGRAVGMAVVNYLKSRSGKGWRDSYISQWPARAGVRESRRWLGEHVLTGDEWLAGTRFDDEIALATWPMEFRETARGPKLRFPVEDRPTGIPLRCLKPAGIDRLFVAGRCISTDHDAQASVRVMGTCFATGEAAGRAAAAVR